MSENRRIARAAGVVGLLTFLSRVAGLVRDVVVGYYFGTSAAADAFFVAFRIPNLLRRFVAEGAMSIALIPVFSDYITNRSRDEAHRAMSAVSTAMVLVLIVLTVAGVVFAPQLTALFAPGFADEPEKFALTIDLTRRLFPYIFLVSLVALATGILHSVRHFTAPALSPVLLNIAIIAAALASPFFDGSVQVLAWGVVIGGVLQVLIQIPPIRAHGIHLRLRWEPRHEAVRRALVLMGPMLFGAAVYQINILVSTILASMLPSGSVSYLWYADRIFEFPLGIFAVALGTAALPSFSAQASRKAYDEMWRSVSFSMRLMTLIVVPASVGIYLLAEPITNVLFQRGAFGHDQVLATAAALRNCSVGLWAVSMVRLIVPAFYALGDAATPVRTAAAAFVTNLIAALVLMGPAEGGDGLIASSLATITREFGLVDLRHAGLSLSTSIAATVNLVLLLAVLRRHLPAMRLVELLPSLGRSLAASSLMAVPVWWLGGGADWGSDPAWWRASVLALALGAGMATYGLGLLALGGEETERLRAILLQRFRRGE